MSSHGLARATFVSCLLLTVTLAAQSPSPAEIIQQADAVRNPSGSFEMTVTLEDNDGRSSEYQVLIKDRDKTLIRTTKPARARGRDWLMLDDQMWAYIPNLRRAVRVSLRQKLSGQAANGDLSRLSWSGDYDAIIESQDDTVWVLRLTAKRKGLTYDGVRVWVDKQTSHPLRAEYLAKSGMLLKRASFRSYAELAGRLRPTEIVIEGAQDDADRSILRIESIRTRTLPDSIFRASTLR